MSEMLDVVGLFRHALAGSVLVGLVCGLLGVHVVARFDERIEKQDHVGRSIRMTL